MRRIYEITTIIYVNTHIIQMRGANPRLHANSHLYVGREPNGVPKLMAQQISKRYEAAARLFSDSNGRVALSYSPRS